MLRPDILSRFESEIFDKWKSIYFVQRDEMVSGEALPDEKEESAQEISEDDAPSQDSATAEEGEMQPEAAVASQKTHAAEYVPERTYDPLNRNDWFDKITDFMAALIKLVYDPEY
jgi:hypothetical protein